MSLFDKFDAIAARRQALDETGARPFNVVIDRVISPTEAIVKKELKDAMTRFGTARMEWVLQLLFQRLYVMRNQVFHGASTKGSSLNRRAIQRAANLLTELLAAMVTVIGGILPGILTSLAVAP